MTRQLIVRFIIQMYIENSQRIIDSIEFFILTEIFAFEFSIRSII